mmetsp:Transcript_8248/g.21369  ORF Transcript_8248/g.21369 Transcript_8248/m.21369 type:complete len:81 (+) Transcript_8248:352-594(+)
MARGRVSLDPTREVACGVLSIGTGESMDCTSRRVEATFGQSEDAALLTLKWRQAVVLAAAAPDARHPAGPDRAASRRDRL